MSQRLNLMAPDVRENPFPHYEALRRAGPATQADPNNLWVVTGYDDVVAALKNPQVFSSAGLRMSAQPSWLKVHNPIADSLLLMDGPPHGRLRTLVTRAFNTATLNRVEPGMRKKAAELVDELLQRRNVDFLSEVAFRLPASVLSTLLGLDPSLEQHFKRWSDSILNAAGVPPDALEMQAGVQQSIEEMDRYTREVIEARRRQPGDDMISDLLRVKVEGESLTDQEVQGFMFLLMVAGLDTTTTLISNAALMFARYPDVMTRVRANPQLIPGFIEETLRYEPPIHATVRLVLAPTAVGGVQLAQYSLVMLSLAAALRDAKQFPNPDRFDIERGGQANLAFGFGAHFCLGASLARLEARVMLEALLPRCSKVTLRTDKLQWNTSLNSRTMLSMPVEVTPA